MSRTIFMLCASVQLCFGTLHIWVPTAQGVALCSDKRATETSGGLAGGFNDTANKLNIGTDGRVFIVSRSNRRFVLEGNQKRVILDIPSFITNKLSKNRDMSISQLAAAIEPYVKAEMLKEKPLPPNYEFDAKFFYPPIPRDTIRIDHLRVRYRQSPLSVTTQITSTSLNVSSPIKYATFGLDNFPPQAYASRLQKYSFFKEFDRTLDQAGSQLSAPLAQTILKAIIKEAHAMQPGISESSDCTVIDYRKGASTKTIQRV